MSGQTSSPVRWLQLALGLIVMMTISSPQYVWTLFVKPLQGATGASLPAIQITFSLLIVLQTWLSPAQGWLVERFGPRVLVAAGAMMSGLGWVVTSQVTSITMLYLVYGGLCGVGTGIVYIGIVGLMARWFPDRRGFAVGIVAAGYGMGAMLTTFPIDSMIKASGYAATLTNFGLIFGAIGLVAALGLRLPSSSDTLPTPSIKVAHGRNASPSEMLKTPVFWLMFAMMTMMSTGGLMVTSNFANFAKEFGVGDAMVLGMATLPLALTVDRLLNGFTRPFFGWVSDQIGRENTMGLAFLLEAVAITLLLVFRENPVAFVLLSGLVFFGWGEIFSLFPSTLTDTFGTRKAMTNYGFLYMSQGIGSVLGGPVAAAIHDGSGSWTSVFIIAIGMDVLTGLLALFVLKQLRSRYIANQASEEIGAASPVTA